MNSQTVLGKVTFLPFGWINSTSCCSPAIPRDCSAPGDSSSRQEPSNLLESREPPARTLPVGQQTHPGVDQQLDQSLGGEEQPHACVLLRQELPTLQAAPGWGWGVPGWGWGVPGGMSWEVSWGAAPCPIAGAAGAPDGRGAGVRTGERRSPGGCGTWLGQGRAHGALGSFVLGRVEEGGDDGYWKKAGEGIREGFSCRSGSTRS